MDLHSRYVRAVLANEAKVWVECCSSVQTNGSRCVETLRKDFNIRQLQILARRVGVALDDDGLCMGKVR